MTAWCMTHKRDHARCQAGEGGITIPCWVTKSEAAGRAVIAIRDKCARLLDWDDRNGMLVPHKITIDELGEVLDLVYPDAADRRVFLESPQELLGGLIPSELVDEGRTDVVVRLLRQVADAVYL